ncbi:nucleoside triphosphate pyrophosphohydrolase family protein [Vibrio fortis]|uniref:nucleoside triphosphate pyrophosphohydrolase family protein n=1 Tax=Vibrio fortis TaxID=212667 RepID=UPI004068BFE9
MKELKRPKLNFLTQELHNKLHKDIIEFRTVMLLPIGDESTLLDKDDNLHTSLIVEELMELADAKLPIDQLDALVDSVYVCYGRVAQLGYAIPEVEYLVDLILTICDKKGFDFVAAWDIVHASNISKVAENESVFEETKQFYAEKGVNVIGETLADGRIVVKAKEDTNYTDNGEEKFIRANKVLKSVNYTPADLSTLV